MLDTKYCILLVYPRGASGKFLLNSLCMNEEFCPQVDYKTLISFYDEQEQQKFLFNKLEDFIKNNPDNFHWDDLGMGDNIFFNVINYSNRFNSSKFYEYYTKKIKESLGVTHAIKNVKYFFRISHTLEHYLFYKDVWNQAKTIQLINTNIWIDLRDSNAKSCIKYKLSSPIIDEIDDAYKVDGQSFLNQDFFLEEYKKLLNFFNVPVKNLDKVATYYNTYVPYLLGKDIDMLGLSIG